MKAEFSIIIVSYNVKNYLMKCVDSIHAFTKGLYEIIVVDNNSTDDSCDELRNNYPSVKLIENKSNVGFSAANNLGIQAASSDLIFLLNPDTEVFDDAINKLA